MKSAIAILTYRRSAALVTMLEGVAAHCPGVPVAIFEDCGQTDDTEVFLVTGRTFKTRSAVYEADIYTGRGTSNLEATVFLGLRNLGVAGNSNRAIRWFMEETDCDHLLLCNDDLCLSGPFHEEYASAHEHHEVGFLSFSNYSDPTHRTTQVIHRGQKLKIVHRMTGAMISMTRRVPETIGYFDDRFFFGQEHCDYNNRARWAGFLVLNDRDQVCLDIVSKYLNTQDVPSSIDALERGRFDQDAAHVIQQAGIGYRWTDIYRSYSTATDIPDVFGGRGDFGIPIQHARRTVPLIVTRGPEDVAGELLPVRPSTCN